MVPSCLGARAGVCACVYDILRRGALEACLPKHNQHREVAACLLLHAFNARHVLVSACVMSLCATLNAF